jgi:hypothetical protein
MKRVRHCYYSWFHHWHHLALSTPLLIFLSRIYEIISSVPRVSMLMTMMMILMMMIVGNWRLLTQPVCYFIYT